MGSKTRGNSQLPNRLSIPDRATLLTTVGTREGELVLQNDIGLLYTWTETQGVDNGGTIINVGTGSWLAKYSGAVNVKWFGAVGDGVTDDSVLITTAVDFIKSNGGTLYIPKGVYPVATIVLSGTTTDFKIEGEGAEQSVLLRKDDTVSSVITGASIGKQVTLKNFGIDCQHSIYPNGNHGISIGDTSDARVLNVNVRDYKNSSIIFYATVARTYSNCIARDCISDGLDNANNGMLVADLDNSGFINCKALNVGKTGSPCYGLQVKNASQDCFIMNGYTSGASVGIALGNYNVLADHKNNKISNCTAFDCDVGLALGKALGNYIDNVVIDMNNSGQAALDFNLNSVGNIVNGASLKNLNTAKKAVKFRDGDTDNVVTIDTIENSSGVAGDRVEFLLGSLRNYVSINKFVNPTNVTDSNSLVSDLSIGSTNVFEYIGLPNRDTTILNGGVATFRHNKINRLIIDTEASSALDDLDTLTSGVDGQLLTISTTVNTRDIVVKHGTGNIKLNGSIDFSLIAVGYTLTLIYNSVLVSWVEVSRGTSV